MALTAAASPSVALAAEPPEPLRPPGAKAAPTPRPAYAHGRVLVAMRGTGGRAAAERAVAHAGGGRVGAGIRGTRFFAATTGGRRPEALVAALRRDPQVAGAQLDFRRTASAVPDDPLFAKGRQGFLTTLRMPAAWDLAHASSSEVIAVVDTGVDAGHPDLTGRVLPGHDFVNDDDDADDDEGHGTEVAGTAAASTDNGVGVAGVAWGGRVLPVKVLGSDGQGYDSDIADGIVWAADHGARVINLSLSGLGRSDVLDDAVAYAAANDAVVVAAAGNSGLPDPEYPAASPGALAVSATDWGGEFAYFSSYGDWIDIAAPGWRSEVPAAGGGGSERYVRDSGTSFASPVVAGTAALVRSQHPDWTQAQVTQRLLGTASDRGPQGIDPYLGHGLVDPVAALGGSPAPAAALGTPDTNGTPDRATPVTVDATSGVFDGISHNGEQDWFTFSVPGPGAYRVAVRTNYNARPRADALDLAFEVYSPTMQFLQRESVFGLDDDESEFLELPAAGRYYVKVENVRGSRSPPGFTGPNGYYLTVESRTYDFGAPSPYLPSGPYDQFFPVEGDASGTAVADLTGDGRKDVVMTSTSNDDVLDLYVFPQTPEGWLGSPDKYEVAGIQGPLAVGDLDGDSDADVAVLTWTGAKVLRQGAAGLGAPETLPDSGDGGRVEIADMDGDGRREVVLSREGATPQVDAYERGSGGWTRRTLATGSLGGDIAIGDLNGDGRLDIAGSGAPAAHAMRLLRQRGDGSFEAEDLPVDTPVVEVADVTGDGRADLIYDDTRIEVRRQNSGGGLDTAVGYDGVGLGYQYDAIETGDVNGDGLRDLVGISTRGADTFLGQFGGTLAASRHSSLPYASRFESYGLAVEDITGDGHADGTIGNPNYGLTLLRSRSAAWPAPGWVRDASPADNARGVPATVAPTVKFARALNAASVTSQTVTLTDASSGQAVAATPSYDASSRIVTVQPGAPLSAGHAYVVKIDGVRDSGGRRMGAGGRSRLEDGLRFVADGPADEPFSVRFGVGTAPADTRAPDTTIYSGPSGTQFGNVHSGRFRFFSDEQTGSFECRFDGAPYAPCSSEDDIGGGVDNSGATHTLWIRARDPAGNVDASPATRTWTVDPGAAPPQNASPSDATPLTGTSGAARATTVGQLFSPSGWNDVSASNPGGESLWYSWTAPASGQLTLSTESSGFDTVLGVFEGGSTPAARLADDDDSGTGTTSRLVIHVVEGQSYRFAVAGFLDSYGDGQGSTAGYAPNGFASLNWSLVEQAPQPPIATTAAPTGITATAAALNGTVDPRGEPTTWWFEYGTSTSYGSSSGEETATGSGARAVSAARGGLEPATTYHYRLAARNSAGTVYGADRSFTTPAAAPAAGSASATAVGATTATLHANVNPHGSATTYAFEYGTTSAYGHTTASESAGAGNAYGEVTTGVSGLAAGTTYHFRVVATNALGTSHGSDSTFTTVEAQAPAVTTGYVPGVSSTGATLTGEVDPRGQAAEYWFEYGQSTAYGSATPKQAGSGAVSVTASPLSPSTTYHYRLVASNPTGTTYGEDRTFTTLGEAPHVTTGAATGITFDAATLSGEVDGRGQATEHRFEYGKTAAYGAATTVASGTGAVSAVVPGLEPSTTYHYRLSATNPTGTTHGEDRTFTTSAQPPEPVAPGATTVAATGVDHQGATIAGDVDPNGAATNVRLEWGTTTAYGNASATTTITSAQRVAATLAGLSPSTTYHFRVVAVSSAGMSAGGDMTFRTTAAPEPPADDDPPADADPPPPGDPPPLGPPTGPGGGIPPDTDSPAAPVVTVKLARTVGRRALLRRGLRLTVTCPAACSARSVLLLGGSSRLLGSARLRLRSERGTGVLRIRLSHAAKRTLRGSRYRTLRVLTQVSGATPEPARFDQRVKLAR